MGLFVRPNNPCPDVAKFDKLNFRDSSRQHLIIHHTSEIEAVCMHTHTHTHSNREREARNWHQVNQEILICNSQLVLWWCYLAASQRLSINLEVHVILQTDETVGDGRTDNTHVQQLGLISHLHSLLE